MSSTKRRLEDATQPLKKKQKVADDDDSKIDAALQYIESVYESLYASLYDGKGATSSTKQSRIATFQDRMTSVVKYNEVKNKELAYRQTVGEQIKRLCDKVGSCDDHQPKAKSGRSRRSEDETAVDRLFSSDFAKTIVKGLRFFKVECKDEFDVDGNAPQWFSTYTADIALKRRSPSTTYIRVMREILNEHTLTDTISDIISGFCSNDNVIWYRIDGHKKSTDCGYQDLLEFETSGFDQLKTDVDDLFRGPMFYKPRDEYTIRARELTVKKLRRDLDESALSKLTDLEVKKFFVDVSTALFGADWGYYLEKAEEKAEELIFEGTAFEKYT